MIVPDINLLLYAEIDAYRVHKDARRWWEEALNGSRTVGLPPPSVFGFLRLSTHRRVFAEPLAVEDAIGRIRRWFDQDNVVLLGPGPAHLDIAFRLMDEAGTGGNLTTDVQIAAYAIEANGEVHSNDRDFGRFQGLRWRNPIGAEKR